MKNIYLSCILLLFFFLFYSCGAYFNQPITAVKARIGENTSPETIVANYLPKEKTVIGVYKFRDQTGQYKPVENGSTFSTAVTQGGTAVLLKSLEDSKWFTPVERENISNLLNERQIIRSTRQEYSKNKTPIKMPPLLFASIIIEGGVISYDSNIITGGSGLRYFGVGASNQYREDRITIYLRVVSTSTGQILKNVYVSKTILSQGISANLFRYVALRRLLEAETGVTKNEPAQLAVKEAIDKAVELLIVEGIIDGLWEPEGGKDIVKIIKEEFKEETKEADATLLYNRKQELRRGENSLSLIGGVSQIDGDYSDAAFKLGFDVKFKHFLKDPRFSFSLGVGKLKLENENIFKESFLTINTNFEYNILPYDRLTPFLYLGLGTLYRKNLSKTFFKYQYGLGLEYLVTNDFGIIVSGQHAILTNDALDNITRGKRNDQIWNVRAGINFYF
jgi:curli production assembly/transport component CsgG